MKTVRFVASGLLLLTGVIHILQITAAAAIDAAIVITVAFGVIYLVLGFLLFRANRTVEWFAAILPLVGLLLAAVGMLSKPTLLGTLFMVFDVAISTSCFYLLFCKGKRVPSQ